MIESGVIVYSFILAGIVSLICFGAFIWMNLKDRDLDEKLFSKKKDVRNKNIRNIVSKYRHKGKVAEEDSIDSLKKYSVGGKKDKDRLEDEEEEKRIREEFSRGKSRQEVRTERSEDTKEDAKKDAKRERENITKKERVKEEIAKEDNTPKNNSKFKPKTELIDEDILTEPKEELSEQEYNEQFRPKK